MQEWGQVEAIKFLRRRISQRNKICKTSSQNAKRMVPVKAVSDGILVPIRARPNIGVDGTDEEMVGLREGATSVFSELKDHDFPLKTLN